MVFFYIQGFLQNISLKKPSINVFLEKSIEKGYTYHFLERII